MACPVLIVGCGDLGGLVASRLAQQGFTVAGVRVSRASLPDGVQCIQADVTKPETLQPLALLRPQILLYCVAASAQTDESYKAHYVDGLRNVLALLMPLNTMRHVFFVSSTRVYGQQTDLLLDELDVAQPADFGGLRLQEAESLLTGLNIPTTTFRLSGIYGPGRTRLIHLARTPLAWPANNTWTNRIHRDDAAAFIAICIAKVDRGDAVEKLYVVTDSYPAPQYEVLQWLAGRQGMEVTKLVTPIAGGGKRLSNQRMLKTGFSLRYPDYKAGYAQLLGMEKGT
jgi:nucleoside-diphosphate-sugar epimerase